MKPQKRVFVLWISYRAHFFRNFPNFPKIKNSKIFSLFFMHKSEHELYDKIIDRYDINMTYFSFIMSYRDLEHLAKVSQNQKSFDLGKYFYLNLPDLKNYLFWTDRTDSEEKTIWLPANAYFAILSQNPGWVENCFQFSRLKKRPCRSKSLVSCQIKRGALFS